MIKLYTDTNQKLRRTLLVLGLETEEEDKSVCNQDQSSKNASSQFMSVEKKRDNQESTAKKYNNLNFESKVILIMNINNMGEDKSAHDLANEL